MRVDEAPILAWHFLPLDRRLAHDDGRLVEVGSVLRVEPPLIACKRGLHASIRPLDALEWAPGPVVCRVEVWGEALTHPSERPNKLCAEYRRVVAMADATITLHKFACDTAEAALLTERAAGREPDPRSWAAIEVKRRWIRGEATDADLAAASAAASDAAWDAANAAAWAAAGPARAAARDAAGAARGAAGAARGAAGAARGAARDDQNRRLEAALLGLLGLPVTGEAAER